MKIEARITMHGPNLLEKIRVLQCPPLNRITLDRHKSDNNNRMIQLTDVFCVLLIYNEDSDI